jgi:tRNA pseudouridine38-40 synthase
MVSCFCSDYDVKLFCAAGLAALVFPRSGLKTPWMNLKRNWRLSLVTGCDLWTAPMKKNFKLVVEYDGTDYHGWQRQKKDRTIQAEIESAIRTMVNRPVTLIGSGRTDAGVHALGQTANFTADTSLTPAVFLNGLNSILPPDILIRSCEEVASTFHARYDVKHKTYRYHLLNRRLRPVVGRQYLWHVRPKLDLTAMRSAIKHIRGEYDFRAFEGAGSPRSHTVREVLRAELTAGENGSITFDICATGFLRYMVRNLVGTLVTVGLGKITPEGFNIILEGKDRSRAGATAPPQGLFLMEVVY